MANRYLSAYEELLTVWTEVKEIIRKNRLYWPEIVNRYRYDLPVDLIKAAHPDRNYRSSQIARVHAARTAKFRTYEYLEMTIGMSQEQIIHREIIEYILIGAADRFCIF